MAAERLTIRLPSELASELRRLPASELRQILATGIGRPELATALRPGWQPGKPRKSVCQNGIASAE